MVKFLIQKDFSWTVHYKWIKYKLGRISCKINALVYFIAVVWRAYGFLLQVILISPRDLLNPQQYLCLHLPCAGIMNMSSTSEFLMLLFRTFAHQIKFFISEGVITWQLHLAGLYCFPIPNCLTMTAIANYQFPLDTSPPSITDYFKATDDPFSI